MKLLSLLIALTAISVLAPGHSHAQGFIKSYSCAPLPPQLRVDVDILDDSAPTQRLRDIVIKGLVKKNIQVDENAPVRLLIDPETLPGLPPSATQDLSRLDAADPATLGAQTPLGRELDALRERSGKTRTLTRAEDIVRIAITMNSKSDGKCLWQGEVRYDSAGGNRDEIAARIAPLLVDAIGTAQNNRPFELP